MSQSRAEIKLLSVSENGWPSYWNSISGFDFDMCIVIGMPFCICSPNFVQILRSAAVLWRHINFSRWRLWSRKSTYGLRFSGGICLKRCKSIFTQNFDEISQSTAEIKLLPVLQNGQPPYWNCISGFDFDVCAVVGMSFYMRLPNFVLIGRSAAEW